jgi:uncharacterized protein
MSDAQSIQLLVDADACPVKDEVMRVAVRHDLPVAFVSNTWMRLDQSPLVTRVVVPEGPDKADDWIAERASLRAIVITADIPLAHRCVTVGATVITPQGKQLSAQNIGMIVATRNLMHDLRSAGVVNTFNATFSRNDRSQFLRALEQAVQTLKRAS